MAWVQAPRGSQPGQSGLSGWQGGECAFPGTGPLGCPGHCRGQAAGGLAGAALGGPGGLTGAQRQGGSRQCVHRGSLPKLLLLFLRLALVKGMSRDSRRKGRGWGISGAWAGGMVELPPSGELRPGGELWCAEEKHRRETRWLARMQGWRKDCMQGMTPARGPGTPSSENLFWLWPWAQRSHLCPKGLGWELGFSSLRLCSLGVKPDKPAAKPCSVTSWEGNFRELLLLSLGFRICNMGTMPGTHLM